MIKIRLLKSKINDSSMLLNSATLPDIDTMDDFYILIRTAGKLLTPYAESLKDPNMVTAMNDTTIKDWTIADYDSMRLALTEDKFDLLITYETGEDLKLAADTVKYIMVDRSNLLLGSIPYGYTQIKTKKEAIDNIAVIDVIQSMLSEFNYFSKKKFVGNPINSTMEQLLESRKILGTINQYAMLKISSMLVTLNKKLYAVALS